jgi:integrase
MWIARPDVEWKRPFDQIRATHHRGCGMVRHEVATYASGLVLPKGHPVKKKHLKKLLKQLQQPEERKPSSPTLSAWLEIHERQMREKGYKRQTVRNRTAIIAHIRRIWGERPIAEIRPHEITTELRAHFLPDHSSTAQRVLCELREVYSEAIANDWAENNPAAHVKMPVHKVLRKRLTFEAWRAMLAVAESRPQSWIRPMLLLALVTGQRRADLAKMRFDDVHDGHLRVEQQKQAGKGYGARIALPLELRLDAIGMTIGDVIEECRAAGAPGDTLLRQSNGRPLTTSSLSVRFADCIRTALGKDAFVAKEWPSLHECRSLTARMYRAQGIEDVQTLLGHKHAEMTAVYEDDRGLSAGEWKAVKLPSQVA